MSVVAGSSFTAALVGGQLTGVGARVEVPVTRAIASYWRPADLSGETWHVTLDAPVSPGDYLLAWMDGENTPSFEIFVPLEVIADSDLVTAVSYPVADRALVRPTSDDVAQLLRTRTIEAGGVEAGRFTDSTRPPVDDVDDVIDQSVDDVLALLRDDFDPKHYPQVKRAITLHAAVMLETSFYRENADDRAVALWREMETSTVAGIQQRIQQDLDKLVLLGVMEPRVPSVPTATLNA